MKLRLDPKKIWTFSLVLYIICSSAFSYGDLRMLNTYALYFFLGVSAINILLKRKVRMNLIGVSLLLYAALILFGTVYTPTIQREATRVMYNYLTMAVIVFCVIQYMDTIEDVKTVILAYMLAGLALAIYVYSQYGSEFWTIMKEATENEFGYVDRLGSELTNTNTIGMYTMFSTVIAGYNVIFDRGSKGKTILCVLIGVFCFMVSMAAASKKSILILLVAGVCIWLYSSLGNRNLGTQVRYFVILIGSFVAFALLINSLPIFSGIASRIESLFSAMDGGSGTVSEANRMAFIQKGLAVWVEHPIFGAGTASSSYYLGVYAHNNYVEILMNTGLIGLFLFYAAYPVALYKYFVNATVYKYKDKVSILLVALFGAMIVCGFALVYYYERYFMILIAVIMTAVKIFDRSRSLTTKSVIERH